MSKSKNTAYYFCVCDQAHSTKSEIRKHVSLCKHAQNQGNQSAICAASKDLLPLAISDSWCKGSVQSPVKDQTTEQYKCGCQKCFKSKGGYYRHIKKCKLRPVQQVVTGRTKCNEPGCLLTFKYIRDFRQHLNEKHNLQFDVENKNFNRYSDFLRWKENYETETRSCFYHRKTEIRSGRRVEYWYCNRSGIYRSASQGHRKLKSQGILKINNNCTSSITLTMSEIEGTVQALIHHTHYGHEADLMHLRIPKSDKQEIASKLLQGVKIEDILLSYKKDGSSKKIERKHLIKRRDILNISKKYNVNIILPKVRQSSKVKKNNESIKNKKPESDKPILKDSSNLEETIKRHAVASQLSLSLVQPIYNNVWRVSMGNNVVPTYSSQNCNGDDFQVTKNDVICCSDGCKVYCNYCNICYHSYSCTCSDFLSKIIICEHIHLAVGFQVTPQTYQYEENIERPLYGNQDHTTYTQNVKECGLSAQSIENIRLKEDVSETSDSNMTDNQDLKLENIKSLKIRLEKLMLESLQKVNECNNSSLLENIERQMTEITCNLSSDLLQNKKKSNEIQTLIVPEKNIEVYYVY